MRGTWAVTQISILLAACLLLPGCLAREPQEKVTKAARPLAITPTVNTVPVGQTVQLLAFDGLPPYTYSVQLGSGVVDPSAGTFVAPSSQDRTVVQVKDSEGSTALALVFTVAQLRIIPDSLRLTATSSLAFAATGGTAPYRFEVVQGTGSVNATSGLFTADTSAGTAVVRVVDSGGFTSQAVVTIYAKPSISLATVSIEEYGRISYSTSGGTPPLVYSVVSGGGSVNSETGAYKAGATGAATVRVTDALGFTSESAVTVYRPNAVASGTSHACYMRASDGKVKCWGRSDLGQTGYESTATLGDGASEMGGFLSYLSLGTGITAKAIAAGSKHSCVITSAGAVKCWGDNSSGQLGIETIAGGSAAIGDAASEMGTALGATSLGTSRTAVQLAMGAAHTCVLALNSATALKEARCWGANGYGQAGVGDNSAGKTAIGDAASEMGDNLQSVSLGFEPIELASGDDHVCALSAAGEVKCWGRNHLGQLGVGSTANALAPSSSVALGTGLKAIGISAGANHACAILESGNLKCWGDNSAGQLGLNSSAQSAVGDASGEMGDALAAIDLGTGKADKVFAGRAHTCAIQQDRSTKCWGANASGQLGLESTLDKGLNSGDVGANLPSLGVGLNRYVVNGSAKGDFNCAVIDDGSVKCWGINADGQLGTGDVSSRGDQANEMGDYLMEVPL
jgi:alpha-tubulin suppressor-like RCC1 family protein